MPLSTSYTINSTEPARISSEEAMSVTVTVCSEDVATGDLMRVTKDTTGTGAYFFSSPGRSIQILDYIDIDNSIIGIPVDLVRDCWAETVECAATDICGPCAL